MQTFTVWKRHIGINEKCIRNESGDYIGIETGNKYDSVNHYHSEQFKAKIIGVDSINQTGMYHLYENEKYEENRKSWKEKYIGCYVTVERAHRFGELTVYRCLELGDYWSSNEIEIIQ